VLSIYFLYSHFNLLPTLTGLQTLFNICECELEELDMHVNAAKSMCIRFGHRLDAPCVEFMSIHDDFLKWVSIHVVTLAYISLAEEHLGAPMIVLNPASLEPVMLSKTKSDVLYRKKWIILCFVLIVCLYSYILQKLALCLHVIKALSNSLLQEYL